MPKLNKSLIATFIEDIRECVCVADEIYFLVGKIEHLSWKFPTKTANDINAMEIVERQKGTAGEFYILLLELAYDRLHFVLRLMLEFVDRYPFVDDFREEVGSIERSNHASLATILRLTWNRLKTVRESISRDSVLNTVSSSGRKVSRGSQAGSALSYCESCSLASEAILALINAIERAFEENKLISAAAAERARSRADIYERTQWAAMSRLAMGIGQDIGTVLGMMRGNDSRESVDKCEEEPGSNTRDDHHEGTPHDLMNALIEDIGTNLKSFLSTMHRNNSEKSAQSSNRQNSQWQWPKVEDYDEVQRILMKNLEKTIRRNFKSHLPSVDKSHSKKPAGKEDEEDALRYLESELSRQTRSIRTLEKEYFEQRERMTNGKYSAEEYFL
ncbi:hypothetical protein KM043_012672 [Ampulex compressa]|nr:hypothetical protein KM043_012672 [Ampulex compressa]